MTNVSKWVSIALSMLAIVAIGAGCKTHAPYEVSVKLLDPGTQSAETVEVHLVPVSDTDFSYWQNMNVTDYWQNENSPRAALVKSGATKVLKFSGAAAAPVVIGRDDPVWDRWISEQKTYAVVILCNVPRDGAAAPGEGDMRRKILYIRRSTKTPTSVHLQITPAGMMRLPE